MYSRPSTASGFCLQGLRRTDYGTCRQGLREPVALRHRVMAIFGRALKQVGENGDVSTKLKRIVTGLDSSKEIRNQIFYLLVKIQLEHHFTDQFQLTLIFYFQLSWWSDGSLRQGLALWSCVVLGGQEKDWRLLNAYQVQGSMLGATHTLCYLVVTILLWRVIAFNF